MEDDRPWGGRSAIESQSRKCYMDVYDVEKNSKHSGTRFFPAADCG
jgi:hypothetical protein